MAGRTRRSSWRPPWLTFPVPRVGWSRFPFGVSDHELALLMCAAGAFCLPSLSEGFGLPAAEAMACGAPTVLSDRAALKEVGGGAAIMVSPDANDIAAGLRPVLQDAELAQKVGAACHERAAEFTWDRCAAQWLQALEAGVKKGMVAQ